MIVEQMVPEIYYKDSRDFAYMGRLIEIVLNYMKTAADNVWVEPSENVNINIIELLVNTLGFESKHEYVTRDLVFVASTFSEMIRNKGSMNAIELAVKTLLNSQKISLKNIEETYSYDQETKTLTIYIPADIVDLVLLDDLMDYILPAGVLYKYVRIESNINMHGSNKVSSQIGIKDTIRHFNDKFTTRIYDIAGETKDIHLGTIYTGTTIDNTIEGEQNNG